MTKLKEPIISMEARGTLGDVLTFQRLHRQGVVRIKPWPTYRRTLSQAYQRWLYQDAGFYWATLTTTQKDAYRATASRLHIPRYAAFLRYYLTNLPDIAGWWKLDELAGITTLDSSKNANNGTIYGAASLPGVIGHARYFDGVDDHIDCGIAPSCDITPDITIELWITPQGSGTWRHYLHKSTGWRADGYAIRLSTADALVFVTTNMAKDCSHAGPLLDGIPYHIIATQLGTTYKKLFVAGALVQTVNNPDALALPTGALVRIGAMEDGAGTWGHGVVDNVLIWNRLLSDHQIQLHSERRWP